jgi:Glycosyl transferase family 2
VKHGVDVTIVLLPFGDAADLARSASDALAQRDVTTEVLSRGTGAPAAVCSAAVRKARATWIAFLEAGDRWHADRLRTMVDAAEERGAAWAYGARVLLGGEDRVVGMALAENPVGVADRLRERNVVGGPSCVLCRRELLANAEPFDARLSALTFWRAWLALAELEAPTACAEPLVAERVDREMLASPRRSLSELRLLRDEGVVRVNEARQKLRLARELRRRGRRRAAAATFLACAVDHRRPQDLLRAAATALSGPARVHGYARPTWLDDGRHPAGGFDSHTPERARSRSGLARRCEVSVIVPTRNRPGFLRQAVTSALQQEDVDLEVLVVDDASDSPLAKSALRFEDPRVRVHVRARPGGAGRARNEALACARGEWIAFLDDDDLFAPMRLRAHLDRPGPAGFGYCGQILVDAGRHAIGTLPASPAPGLAQRLRTWSSIGGPSAVVARTELLRQVGGFDEDYYALGDWDLWMRLAAQATAVATPELLVAYTVHPTNMHRLAPERVLADFSRFERRHDVAPLAEIELVEWLARELRAAGRGRAAAGLHLRVARRHRHPGSAIRAMQAVRRRADSPRETPRLESPQWLRHYGAVDAH